VHVSDDEDMEQDIIKLSELTGNTEFQQTYSQLDGPVQKSDFWRYAKLYLEGGIYADVDVVALPEIVSLIQQFLQTNKELIVFVENFWFFGWFGLVFRLDSMVRYPQYRQCIMVAKRSNEQVFLTALTIITEKVKSGTTSTLTEPSRTLELTGPGVYTDAVNSYCFAAGKDAEKCLVIYRYKGFIFFHHVGTASWKNGTSFTTFNERAPIAALIMFGCALFVVILKHKGPRLYTVAVSNLSTSPKFILSSFNSQPDARKVSKET